jgi:hypothetical protein
MIHSDGVSLVLGIVGHEAAKFTAGSEAEARRQIRAAILSLSPTKVVSGACHLGGIDIWAIEEAKALDLETEEFPPKFRRWEPEGFKARNEKIVAAADVVLCVVVDSLPESYKGMKFEACYHCVGGGGCGTQHVKSGGCWTAKRSKRPMWVVIPQVPEGPEPK